MSVSNSFMLVDWDKFCTEYKQHGESSFLVELIDELDDYPNTNVIKNSWFEYLQLDSEIGSAIHTGMMYEQVEEAKNNISKQEYNLLSEVIGILNVDLTGPYNDLDKGESEYWLYSSYGPTSVEDVKSRIDALSSSLDMFEITQELKNSFKSYVNDIQGVFNKAATDNLGVLIAIG